MAQLQNIGELDIPGSIAAEAITQALNEAYGGANQRLVSSFAGQLEKLQDKAKLTVLAFMGLDESFRIIEGSLFDRLKGIIASINEFLDQHQEGIVQLGKSLGQSLPFMIGLATFALGIFAGAIVGILGPVLELALILGGIGAVFGLVAQGLINLEEKTGIFSTAWQTIVDFFRNIVDFFQNRVVPIFQTVGGFLVTLFTNIANILGPIFVKVWEQLQPALEELRQAFLSLIPSLERLFGFIGNVASSLGVFLTNIKTLVAGIIVSLAMFLVNIGALVTGIITAFAKALPFIINIWTAIISFLQGAIDFIVALFTGNWELLIDATFRMITSIASFIANLVTGVLALISGFVEGVLAFFKGLYDALVGGSIIPDMVNAILDWFSSLKTKAIEFVGGLISGIREKFLGAARSAFDWGKNVVANFIEGLKNAIKGTGGAFMAVAERMGLADLFKQHGGIIPGPIGAPVPIIAHAGERIVPRTGADVGAFGGSNVTINFYGGVQMDSEQRVQQLADKIGKMLGRQNELARYGLG